MKIFRVIFSIILIVFILPFQNSCAGRDNRSVVRNASNRVALVIGNGRYQSDLLKNPVNDAKDMAAMQSSRIQGDT